MKFSQYNIIVKYFTLIIFTLLPFFTLAQSFRSDEYCRQLAEIGSNAYLTKKEGYSMEAVNRKIASILADDPLKLQSAQGVVMAIYGDGSIRSAKQAYQIVYTSCKR